MVVGRTTVVGVMIMGGHWRLGCTGGLHVAVRLGLRRSIGWLLHHWCFVHLFRMQIASFRMTLTRQPVIDVFCIKDIVLCLQMGMLLLVHSFHRRVSAFGRPITTNRF